MKTFSPKAFWSFFLLLSFFCDVNNYGSEIINSQLDVDNATQANFTAIKVGYYIPSKSSSFLKQCATEVRYALSCGGELNFVLLESDKNYSIGQLKKIAVENEIYVLISFTETDDALVCSVYDCNDNSKKQFTYKKQYEKMDIFLRTICSDIWKVVFGVSVTPYDFVLCYAIHDNIKKNWNITVQSPFTKKLERLMLTTKNAILDLSAIATIPQESLIFSQITNKNVRIVKLTSRGINSIVDVQGTCTSLCPLINNMLYVCSGNLYEMYYEKKNKKWHTLKIPNENNFLYASVVRGNDDNTIFIARNFKIMKGSIKYNKKNNMHPIVKIEESQISPEGVAATSLSYCYETDTLVTTERINGLMQIVIYTDVSKHNVKRIVLTNSHCNKQDVSISPCGTYIAYIHFNPVTGLFVPELINIYTKKVIRVVSKDDYSHEGRMNKRYGSVCWLKRI